MLGSPVVEGNDEQNHFFLLILLALTGSMWHISQTFIRIDYSIINIFP